MTKSMIAAATIALSGVALAQNPGEVPPFPLVNDLAEGWELGGQPVPLDVLGIRIGMPREQAQAAAIEGIGIDPTEGQLGEYEIGISGEYGISVFFRYPATFTANKNSEGGGQDFLMMIYTTGVTGERVAQVTRTLRWPDSQLPRRPDIEASVREKYGEPSLVDPNSSDFMATSHWVYFKGEKITYPAGTRTLGMPEAGSPDTCLGLMPDVAGPYAYNDQPDGYGTRRKAQELMKDCGIVLSVTINGSMTPGLVESLSVTMTGPSRLFENGIATDKLLDEKLAEKLAGDSPAPAAGPKL